MLFQTRSSVVAMWKAPQPGSEGDLGSPNLYSALSGLPVKGNQRHDEPHCRSFKSIIVFLNYSCY